MIYAVVDLIFLFQGGVGRAAAGQPGEEELRGQDQGEPGEDQRLPHPRRHGWILWQTPLWLRPTYFCRWLAAFPGTVVSCSLVHRLVFVGVCMVAS